MEDAIGDGTRHVSRGSSSVYLLAFSLANVALYVVGGWTTSWERPNWSSYICAIAAICTVLLASGRIVRSPRYWPAPVLAVLISLAVLWHVVILPCTGACK